MKVLKICPEDNIIKFDEIMEKDGTWKKSSGGYDPRMVKLLKYCSNDYVYFIVEENGEHGLLRDKI